MYLSAKPDKNSYFFLFIAPFMLCTGRFCAFFTGFEPDGHQTLAATYLMFFAFSFLSLSATP